MSLRKLNKNNNFEKFLILIITIFLIYEVVVLTAFIRASHTVLNQEAVATLIGLMLMFGTTLKCILEKLLRNE